MSIKNIRISKKIIYATVAFLIVILSLQLIKPAKFILNSVRAESIINQGYQLLEDPENTKPVIDINGVNITYGHLLFKAKEIEAYSTDIEGSDDQKYMNYAILDYSYKILMYTEISRENLKIENQPDNQEIFNYYNRIYEETLFAKKSPQLYGVAKVKQENIEKELDYYKMVYTIYLWLNQNQESVISEDDMITDEELIEYINELDKKLYSALNSAIKNAEITYYDESYNYIDKKFLENAFFVH
ncbi:hypothetical protein GC105_02050 [Alkalibaculum sp. M08DMB]|uniref:Uncharacterized protein n=1 Tax=Alkalibaculum sporogenes TaxID=2655001 RepID=A0A6A7K5B6_9FIRM|nr:hypothetical protein [Alkalibaculum sporogenes]MPW24575.1 hypothetical protein [Alkalibaculum sporogenes]